LNEPPEPERTWPVWVANGLIVLLLLGVCGGVVSVNVLGFLEGGGDHVGASRIQIKKLEESLVVYAAKHKGVFPASLEDARKYMPDGVVPTDAWGNPYLYMRADTPYLIVSLGADGKPGGEGEDADIRSDRSSY
jgi:general secretion pathway protein G